MQSAPGNIFNAKQLRLLRFGGRNMQKLSSDRIDNGGITIFSTQ